MQSTGLRDEKKTEIYEDDIIELTNTGSMKEPRLLVRWVGPDLFLLSRKADGKFSMEKWDKPDTSQYRIVGNIYQNPVPF